MDRSNHKMRPKLRLLSRHSQSRRGLAPYGTINGRQKSRQERGAAMQNSKAIKAAETFGLQNNLLTDDDFEDCSLMYNDHLSEQCRPAEVSVDPRWGRGPIDH